VQREREKITKSFEFRNSKLKTQNSELYNPLRSLRLKGKKPRDGRFRHRCAIRAPLERLGVADAPAGLLAIADDQLVAEGVGVAAQARVEMLAQPGAALVGRGGHLAEGFVRWQLRAGAAVSTVNRRLFTVKTYAGEG
jgi:hypothetical protein